MCIMYVLVCHAYGMCVYIYVICVHNWICACMYISVYSVYMLLHAYIVCLCECADMNVCVYIYICNLMFICEHMHKCITNYAQSGHMFASSGVEVYVHIHLRMGLYICLCMYV